ITFPFFVQLSQKNSPPFLSTHPNPSRSSTKGSHEFGRRVASDGLSAQHRPASSIGRVASSGE
ncbi:unnamed protein product, partial [Linum tenue]